MDAKTFQKFRELIYAKSGISLQDGKEALVSGRVGKRLKDLGMTDWNEYLDYVNSDSSGEEVVRLLDVISTNVTSFFREPEHFVVLEQLMEMWLKEGQRRFRVWCAASSTGEEPYTILMAANQAMSRASDGGHGVDFKLLATDISTRVLTQAKRAAYPRELLEHIPPRYHAKSLTLSNHDGNKGFEINDSLKRQVVFSRLNLSTPPFPMTGPFDAVFCRNVMIYFDNSVRTRLVTEITRLLKPGGFLFVGHSETLAGMDLPLRAIRPSIYRRLPS